MITLNRIRRLNTIHLRNIRNYSSVKAVLLPKTEFPLRVNSKKRKERDLWIADEAAFSELYKWQRSQSYSEEFILHDGPPYANGKPHMGHALNKILKDITNRFQLLSGKKISYIPGWDCHGLPIELKALGTNTNKTSKLDALQIRSKAKLFAKDAIKVQSSAFKQWGVMADWNEGCYYTFEQDYITKQLRLFYELYNQNLVLRDYKPVYWSPSSRTALAESELEYKADHVSDSIYLKLKLGDPLPAGFSSICGGAPVHIVIWTTTPWSIPANQAVCYNASKDYCLVRMKTQGDESYFLVIASELVATLETLWSTQFELLSQFPGSSLSGSHYFHPLQKANVLPLLPADHVTMTKGTGFVHTAPAHGQDDFIVALKHHIPILNLIDDEGNYNGETGSEFKGLNVLVEGQQKVLDHLKKNIVHYERYEHSYPYDWRTKLPVILRASLQWFIDTESIKNRALEAMKDVVVVPSTLDKPMLNQLAKRPYWCISRQRSWGVPIPVFYRTNTAVEEVIFNKEIIERLCNLIMKKGSDCWWEMSAEELIGNDIMNRLDIAPGQIKKGMDIMDIWFDSGASWNCVLPENKQADVYMEGIDQFGGWFQSSLLTSVAITSKAPYKKIFVHGFTLDDKGRKMSKSMGNVIDPSDIIDGDGKKQPAYGVDILRWWTASHVTRNGSSSSVSSAIIKQAAEDVQKFRSVLRFLLGNLNGTTQSQLDKVVVDRLNPTDRYILHLLADFVANSLLAYEDMNYKKVSSLLTQFVNSQVSAFYCHLVKDRLYCHSIDSETRLGAVYVLNEILNNVVLVLAPLLPHLAEEVYFYQPLRQGDGGLFRSRKLSSLHDFSNSEVVDWMAPALVVREEINRLLGATNTKEWDVTLLCNAQDLNTLQKFQGEPTSAESSLCELLQVASVTLSPHSAATSPPVIDEEAKDVKHSDIHHSGTMRLTLTKTQMKLCSRCRRYTSVDGEICSFCSNIA